MSAREGASGAAGGLASGEGACRASRPVAPIAAMDAASGEDARGASFACVRAAGGCAAAQAMSDAAASAAFERVPVRLFDMHCHLDFLSDDAARDVAAAASALGIGGFSCTVTPAGYVRARRLFAGCESVRAGVGLHPWWTSDGRIDDAALDVFSQAAAGARFVGEVGLDFAPRHIGSRERQVAAFQAALDACAQGGKVVSVHAVRSAGEVLDMLEARGTCEKNDCILHWFSGTSDELFRAVRQGCFFSVGPRMLSTRRGRAYVRAIPRGRLLLETDEPAEGASYDVRAWGRDLHCALRRLSEARGEDELELGEGIARTSARLLGEE